MLKDKKIAFIGSGNMAEALISSLIDSSVFNPNDILCSDISKKRLEYVHNNYNIHTSSDNIDAAQKADIIILSVKPQIILKVLDQISETVDSSKLIISIAAGISLDLIQKALSKEGAKTFRLIRAMPNTPALVQTGATALTKGAHASENDLKAAFEIFSAVGKAVEINEDLMDAVTGLSGSGPAYVFLIIDALADAGVKVGLPKDISMTLSVQTVLGAAKLASESEDHPAKLKDMVTSPGGTTIAGINSLEEGNLKAVLMNAVEAATQRSRELGSIQKKNAGLK
ncbi:MAG: pyrroline-5-carboxylate reductase [Nitrospinota bacterium]